MRRMISRLLGRRKVVEGLPEETCGKLPNAVREMIDLSGITPRLGLEGDAPPPPTLFLPGRSPVIYNRDVAPRLIGNIFPELSDEQCQQAARRLHSHIVMQQRQFEMTRGARGRRNWMTDY